MQQKKLFRHAGLAAISCGALVATHFAASIGGASSHDQNVLEGKREAAQWFERGREGKNEEAAEIEEVFESEEWEVESDKVHEEWLSETQEEISESGGSGTEGAREGRIEWMRENKEDQDGPPRPDDPKTTTTKL